MIIYGAGLAGLLVANMLRRFQPVIHEAQPSLPNNHEALLRFRSDAVSRVTGIPFQRVEVTKAIQYRGQLLSQPDILTNNLYSCKATGEYRAHSISSLQPVERFIAPLNFIQQMANSCQVECNQSLDRTTMKARLLDSSAPVISTIPMPVLMDLVDWPNKPEFSYRPIWSVWVEILAPRMDLYQTIYFPHPAMPFYRVSITGNRVIIEFSSYPTKWHSELCEGELRAVLSEFGITGNLKFGPVNYKEQKYGKLLPIDNVERRRFLLAMTDEYRLYSVGRFATWRQILLDDVVHDIQLVEGWIEDRSSYMRRLQEQE